MANINNPTAQIFDRSRQKEKKRQAVILEGALAFSENGYAGTTLDMLAHRLGISKKALYHYVSGKSQILFGIFQLWLDLQEEAIDQAESHTGDSEAKLRTYVRDYIGSVYSHFVPMDRIVGELETLPDEQIAAIQKRRRENDARLARLFESGAGAEFADWEPRYAIHALNGAIDWIFKWLKPGGLVVPEQAADKIMDILVKGLAARA
ncbi:TetR/AcrR family transcriptional regulator [Erythrobacter aureus]|uniref:TetR/AcrR family transcriptional regulator n=1 Tax=Erythrobacter aureus TaxID=2182384 RepID=UPI003A8D62C5